MQEKRILIVEDDVTFGAMLQSWFKRNGFESLWCSKISDAQQKLEDIDIDLVISDLRLPDGDGIMLLQWIRERKIETPVILMTSYGEIQSAVSAMKLGAKDYLQKPINPSILKEKVEQALASKTAYIEPIKIKIEHKSGIVFGKSIAATTMYEHIKKIAPTKMAVLILGESGTGKEYAARMIHQNSPRSNHPFIAVDCGSLSKELAPSELFGHLKGSFTSAIKDNIGVFEQANRGTVFLDEIGNLSYEVQIQLLRALQEGKIRPVGAANDMAIDVRIIAATNEDLETAIEEGRFREDLYHRINEFPILLPPLRDRIEDIEEFISMFINQANEELDKQIVGVSEDALKKLKAYRWGGNLRELRNVIRRAVLFASSNKIDADDLPLLPKAINSEDLTLHPDNEKQQIEIALDRARGNKSLAAQMLKIDRKTLYNKMHLYNIIVVRQKSKKPL